MIAVGHSRVCFLASLVHIRFAPSANRELWALETVLVINFTGRADNVRANVINTVASLSGAICISGTDHGSAADGQHMLMIRVNRNIATPFKTGEEG